jgi:hypothetical protein
VELIETFLNYQARRARRGARDAHAAARRRSPTRSLAALALHLLAQDHIKRCVCIIYDPVRSVQGTIALKARAPTLAHPRLGFRLALRSHAAAQRRPLPRACR